MTRRHVLRQTLPAALLIPPAHGQSPAPRPLRIVVTGGHPGDPEYGCGGTIARYSAQGSRVTLLDLNRGEGGIPGKSADEAGQQRTAEARTACDLLGAQPRFAAQVDGAAIVDRPHHEQFRRLLEAEQPDVLFTQWAVDNHPDHRAISSLCYDAWLRLGRTAAFYFYEVSNGEDTQLFSPSDYVDISTVEPRKRSACYAHASQSPDRYYALQSQIARFRGLEAGVPQAEAFLRHPRGPAGRLPLNR